MDVRSSTHSILPSRNDFVKHLTSHICQLEVTAGTAVREAFVIDAQQVKNFRVQIVDVDSVMDGAKTKVIGFSVRHATFDASASHVVKPK